MKQIKAEEVSGFGVWTATILDLVVRENYHLICSKHCLSRWCQTARELLSGLLSLECYCRVVLPVWNECYVYLFLFFWRLAATSVLESLLDIHNTCRQHSSLEQERNPCLPQEIVFSVWWALLSTGNGIVSPFLSWKMFGSETASVDWQCSLQFSSTIVSLQSHFPVTSKEWFHLAMRNHPHDFVHAWALM